MLHFVQIGETDKSKERERKREKEREREKCLLAVYMWALIDFLIFRCK
jgi:hypothetical protein